MDELSPGCGRASSGRTYIVATEPLGQRASKR